MSITDPLIRPFRALRPAPGRAADVVAPPYDVLSSDEARARAVGRPWSFLHVSKAEIDLPPGTDPHTPAVYGAASDSLRRMREAGVLVREPRPAYYAWRMQAGAHVQTGLAVSASVAAYASNRIRRHEHTLPTKEQDRARQIEAVGAQTGPALLAYPDAPAIDAAIERATLASPIAVAALDDGVRHTLWVIDGEDEVAALGEAVERLPALYIADGHHRSAAAARVAAAHRGTPDASAHYFLAVLFPARQMRILDYNRVVRDLNGHAPAELRAALARLGALTPSAGAVRPDRPARFGIYLDGRWLALDLDPARVPAGDPVASLDVSLLTAQILTPLLGIEDLRRDPRIDFVGGIRGLQELERRVDSGEMAVAFALFPTPIDALFAVADAGDVMPPKSTWFEPKLADGLLSHVLD